MKILCGIDGSAEASAAAELLAEVAARSHEVLVMSVVDPGTVLPVRQQTLMARRAEAEGAVKSLVSFLSESGFKVTGRVAYGLPGEQLVWASAAETVDVTLVGARGRGRATAALLGSVSDYVLHRAANSVMVVRDHSPADPPAQVVVGVDGSLGSHLAVEIAAELFDSSRCELLAVAATDGNQPLSSLTVMGRWNDPTVGYEPDGEHDPGRGSSPAAAAVRRLRSRGFQVAGVTVSGPARSSIFSQTMDREAGLVVVGSRRSAPMRAALLGSVSGWLAHHCPAVLVAKPTTAGSVF